MTNTHTGHHHLVAQPHTDAEGPIADAEVRAAQMRSEDRPLGPSGPRADWRSPFFIGLTGAAGVAVTYAAVRALMSVSSMLLLISAALFIALGLEPAVSWLVRRRAPRWAAVTVVLIALFALVVGAIAAVITPLLQQARQFVDRAPQYVQSIQNHSSWIGSLNDRFGLQQRVTDAVHGSGGSAVGEVVKAGSTVVGGIADIFILAVLTVYFLISVPRIRATAYRLAPNSRRPRVILIGDQICAKVGAYLLGNVVISVITGLATFVWLVAFGIPYPVLLSIFVALLDLVPFGSTVAGFIVAAVALTVSFPLALATVAFYVVLRVIEDYLLVPKIVGRAVDVPAVTTVVAVLIGGGLLGIVGALVAIPVAAAIQLIVREVLFPRLDEL
ncbi:AI-2E family transporter [Mycobacterium yunnanensis]|uniref:AI-2E family transporter n=1 Tax=Mycobacterium yunnanensis TaxID=368477 RepID=A0A9X2YYK4_9MYCO|nr:AI-2E family transporter [Mycobacterium yunnanensis]MCV7419844.1 AI-2E family transporter [Mycobacterium yunnanensis]